MKLSVVILAAGQGTRMRSQMPKVLHPLAGRPLLEHVIATAQRLQPYQVHVVYGHGGDQVLRTLQHCAVQWVEQRERLGTGHAVAQAMPNVADDEWVLVLYGDVPLITEATLRALVERATASPDASLGLLTAILDQPKGYGRIVRDAHDQVTSIVEEKDATAEQKRIREVNTGVIVAPALQLRRWLSALQNNNAQGEYYLTDVIAKAVDDNIPVHTVYPADEAEFLGVNDKMQLAELERQYQRQQADFLMSQGVTLSDPDRFDVRGELYVGRDVVIDINCVFEGKVSLGDNVTIGPFCVVRDSVIAHGTQIKSHCVIEETHVGEHNIIGPFARLRPGTVLANEVHVGNFVELKKAVVDQGSKINHLSYIGDATIGKRVNVGAGTITCNYDGANKHQTVIGDDAFIGSNSQLVAPVTVGAGATIGAGSTISRDAPEGQLTLSRMPQKSIAGWKRPSKKSQ
ncbi:MAG: bifunctional UDP-N-acetylglucosamine diphosphorylase/glucosamine-1-phosphate N-acetyltransferase GlmU [Gammaproteobacteria bacterium]|nr:bifunctional UDP-N-acetylglucosamine diphosphorylase/glucosamine-1-phosphate N-acetyltransferase GlmU [Gammaproteobacteria bacterium]